MINRRRQIFFSLFDSRGFGLEIGPNCKPLLPKADYKVETLDHMSADGLRAKYAEDPNVDVSKIEEVDYVANDSIFEAVGQEARYDFIIASHVIEHVTDLHGFLSDCERLLKPTGRLVLAIPDRRRCFDRFRPSSTTGQVLEARGRTNSSPGRIFDHVAYITEEHGGLHPRLLRFVPTSFRRFYFTGSLQAAFAAYEEAKRKPGFVDIHAWHFTPSSFRLIIADLADLGLLSLREESFVDTVGVEFFVCLSRSGRCPVDRLTLARGI